MRTNYWAIILTAAALIRPAQAVTAPPATPTVCDTLKISWTLPTTRIDGSALPLSELAKVQLWFTNETAPIDVTAPATSYNYKIPIGYTTTVTDAMAATVTDTAGLESTMSPLVLLGANHKCPKALPAAPTLGPITVQ